MLDVVVQIVSYKSKQYLSNCLDSLIEGFRDSDITFEILILENGSGEDLAEVENKYKSERVAFYYSDKNLGFGAGHNLLSTKKKSTYLFALNPDTIVAKDAIKKLFNFMEAHPEAGLCGPRVEEPFGFWQHKRVFWPKKFIAKRFFEKFLGVNIFKDTKALESNPILGSALFFRMSAFEAIGGFDEHLFLYFEEGDICNSLRTRKWKIFFIYDAVVTHFYYRKHFQHKNARIYQESKTYFLQKWPRGDIK